MKKFLRPINFLYIVLLLPFFLENVYAQTYTITGNINSSALTCATFTGYNVINIGNGSASSSLIMNDDLDLRSCSLGPLQVVVNNATIDFSIANKRLYLPEGSSISFVNGGTFNPAGGNGGGCTGNDRIYIGTVLLAACQGGSGILGFDDLIDFGGTGRVTSNSPVCNGNTINLAAFPPPNGGPYAYQWSGPNGFSSTSQNPASFSATNSPNTAGVYAVTMTSTTLSTNKSIIAQTTVIVNSLVNNVGSGFSSSSFCAGDQATMTFDANNGSGVYPYTLVYRNDTTLATASVSIANDNPTSFNIVPNPAVTTDYTLISITDANGCVRTSGFVDPTARATINALPNAPTIGTITQSTCAVATGSVVLSGLPASGTWTLTRNGTSSATTTGTGTSTTISGLVAGTYNFTVSNASGCTSISSANVGINIQPSTPTAPSIATTQPTCGTTTGIITISAVAGETYSFDGGAYSSTLVYSGLVQGSSHTISAKNSSGCISAVANVTINTLSTKTWNGSWSPAGAPTSNDFVVINANYSASSDGDLNACSLTINSGSKLTIELGKFVIIQNNLTVNGTLDVLDKGSLVMVNDSGIVTNSGTTTIHRFTTPFKKYDYTYWSTPVVSTNIASTFLGWNTGYSYEYLTANFLDANNDGLDDDGNDWSFASTMTPGKGYIIMVPTPIAGPFGNNPSEVVFSGKVNNGIQKITSVLPDNSYLIGNPYPSAIDAEAFLDYNSGVLDGTLYFWTHNTAIQAANPSNTSLGTGAFAFTSDDYASYNAVGGVGVGSGTAATTGVTIPNGKIASGQGFFASSKVTISGTNEIVFNNSMRLSSGGAALDNSQFFKTRNPKGKVTSSIEKNRVWLNLTNTQGAFKQTLVGYITDATNDYDSRFDGESFDGNEFVDFYSIIQDKNLTIQGRALPFDENDQVPLGFRTTIDGTFTINIDQADGILASQQVFIEDKLTNTISDLKSGNYTFSTTSGIFNDRFVLRYKNNDKTLGTENFDSLGNTVLVSSKNKQLKINSFAETIDKVMVYDLLGRQFYQKDNVNNNEFLTTDFILSHQTLVVKTVLQNGAIVTNKIVF